MGTEQEHIKRVVQDGGTGYRERKGLAKLADIVFTSDIKEVEDWALNEQLLPWIKSTLIGAISRFTLHGRTGYSGTSSTKPSGTTYSYNQPQVQPPSTTMRGLVYGPNDTGRIVIKNRDGQSGFDIAQTILQTLDEYLLKYGKVRVMDYYEAVGATGSPECQNWGWESIAKASIMPIGNGEAWIAMPKPVPFR